MKFSEGRETRFLLYGLTVGWVDSTSIGYESPSIPLHALQNMILNGIIDPPHRLFAPFPPARCLLTLTESSDPPFIQTP